MGSGLSADESIRLKAGVFEAIVDQGDTGDAAVQAAQAQGMRLEVVKLPEAKRGFVRLVAEPLGRGAQFCLDDALSSPGSRR